MNTPGIIAESAAYIKSLQRADGSIPWIDRGIWDAWNHGESVMGLAIAGNQADALRGLDCLIERQNADGGFTGDLGASVPLDDDNRRLVPGTPEQARDTNFTGYVAVTVLRSLLAMKAADKVERYWPMVERAVEFVLRHQGPAGDIVWRGLDEGDSLEEIDSLRAGNASLYKSIECALLLARAMDEDRPHWAEARRAIGATLRENDARFDRFGIDRRRYAMDWYYPVLAGVLPQETGRARLYARWNEFVEAGLGCRCVTDEPWVTAAETAELALACLAAGKRDEARSLLENLEPLRAADGGYWMGWQFAESVVWPYERPSWTAGAMIMALDALEGLTPGSNLLIRTIVPELTSQPARPDGAGLPAFLFD
ncbi:MAG: hypothetical protein QUV02_05565 [Maricaulis sp.]|uniref:hypothetical protein n=1 Tax=Maricaulis sp. TaxID=1486257 RepID=UPI002601EB61|nr:hypothetical protein [Maricaulis sp.]MDM7983897.1 hypothetical protein [Maricaulis sp.]